MTVSGFFWVNVSILCSRLEHDQNVIPFGFDTSERERISNDLEGSAVKRLTVLFYIDLESGVVRAS